MTGVLHHIQPLVEVGFFSCQAGLKLQSSQSPTPEQLGLQAWAPSCKHFQSHSRNCPVHTPWSHKGPAAYATPSGVGQDFGFRALVRRGTALMHRFFGEVSMTSHPEKGARHKRTHSQRFHSYDLSRTHESTETGSRLVAVRGWEGLLMGTRLSSGMAEVSRRTWWWWTHSPVNCAR
jgi:hypothetical protein